MKYCWEPMHDQPLDLTRINPGCPRVVVPVWAWEQPEGPIDDGHMWLIPHRIERDVYDRIPGTTQWQFVGRFKVA